MMKCARLPHTVAKHALWQDSVLGMATIVDRVELAETYVDDDEQRLDDLLARYGDVLEGMSFREIKRFIESTHEIYVINAREATTILTQLGLAPAPALAMALGASFESISLNLERMDLIDTGAIFIYHYPTEDQLPVKEGVFRKSDGWRNLA